MRNYKAWTALLLPSVLVLFCQTPPPNLRGESQTRSKASSSPVEASQAEKAAVARLGLPEGSTLVVAAPATSAKLLVRQAPPAPAPTPGVRLPDVVPPPQPPVPPPTTPTSLGADQLYVIDADAPCIVVVSPAGLVKITNETGPLKIKAKFVDSPPGVYQCRTFKGKNLYLLEAAGTGSAELIVFLAGSTDPTSVIRRQLNVSNGVPPGPGPTPPPTPTDPFTAAVLAAYSLEPPATRAADAVNWANLFTAAVGHVDSASVVTNADLLADLKTTLAASRAGALPKVKAVLVAEMNGFWGTAPNKQLDKPAAKAELSRIAQALGTLK